MCPSSSKNRLRLVRVGGICARVKGLLGRTCAPGGRTGLWFPRCRAIHTFGMRFPIDVAFMDSQGEVCRLIRNLRPGRIAVCLRASSVIELAVNADDSPLRYRRRLRLAWKRMQG